MSVQDKTSTYDIYAKKVILACGDFASNPDMIKQYAPEFEKGLIFGAGTNTGDGLRMALEVGAVPLGDTMMGSLGYDGIVGIHPDYRTFCDYGAGRSMIVNVEAIASLMRLAVGTNRITGCCVRRSLWLGALWTTTIRRFRRYWTPSWMIFTMRIRSKSWLL